MTRDKGGNIIDEQMQKLETKVEQNSMRNGCLIETWTHEGLRFSNNFYGQVHNAEPAKLAELDLNFMK